MSINYDRKVTKDVTDNGTYKKLQLKILYPIYWDEGINLRKGLYTSQYRMYRTWKYTRKNQYK